MHELSLCRHIIEIIQQQSSLFIGKTIKVVHIEIGELLAVEKSALTFSFDLIKKTTIAKSATLNLTIRSGQAQCHSCQKTVNISQYNHCCPNCSQFGLMITSGEELRIVSIEVI